AEGIIQRNLLNDPWLEIQRRTKTQFCFITIEDLKKLFLITHKATHPLPSQQRSPRYRRRRPQNHPRESSTTAAMLLRRRGARRFRPRFLPWHSRDDRSVN